MSDSGWSLDIKEMSWVENTEKEVSFIIESLHLKGNERILDIACGFGRHSLELARRGFSIVGVDYTDEFIEDAVSSAKNENLKVSFIHTDALKLEYSEEFDVVLNMADGAIGYFASEEENLRLFDIIANALKKGGKQVMGVCNASFFKHSCPYHTWQAGKKVLSIADFLFDEKTSRYFYRSHEFRFGEILNQIDDHFPDDSNDLGIRLYSFKELESILKERSMRILNAYGAYDINIPSDDKHYMLVVCSQKYD